MNNRKDIIPNNLKEYRTKCNYTQKQVAQLLGFSNSVQICHWENGKNVPGLINLLKLCDLYKAGPKELYSELTKKLKVDRNIKRVID